MATWCFDKREADNCCSPAVFGSVYRSLTYSFGSICFGSLLQALISVFRCVVEAARRERQRADDRGGVCGDIVLCILECIAKLLEDVIDYFNQWAYVFVGIYGFSYLESGRRVIELFRVRGWTTIVNNSLVSYVLGFTTVLVGICTGAVALLLEYVVSEQKLHPGAEYESYIFGPIPGWRWWAFG
jgi:Plasma-membrane choline transporter